MTIRINGTTGISGIDGTAAQPAYVGVDTNTGIFFPAADTIAFVEGGTEVMRINSSGNVGVGTTSPQTKLDVVGGINGTIISGTAVSAASTMVNFTDIPSWAKRVTVMFDAVSTSGTASVGLQIGDAGGIETTGYSGAIMDEIGGANFSAGFFDNTANAAGVRHFVYTLVNVTGNTWACQIVGGLSNSAGGRWGCGTKTLSDVLTQVRITTNNGTDTFDAGSINLLLEG